MVFYGEPRLKRRLPSRTPEGEPIYQVADDLQTYREMLGVDQDWKLESFHNHAHFSHRDGDEVCLRNQLRDADETEAILRERFPERRFVVLVAPLDLNTVYQASEGAPTEDGGEWEPNGPLAGIALQEMLRTPGADPGRVRADAFDLYRERSCERCKDKWGYEANYAKEDYPGARWADCPQCGLPHVVAVRTLRRIVPTEE